MSFDMERIEKILRDAKEVIHGSRMQELETKYAYLRSFYSQAYMSGSDWYVGPSIRDYIGKRDIRLIFRRDNRLRLLTAILDNNMFPSIRPY